jgi:hypothetical protein
MADYSREKWIEIYQKAFLELEHARMRGRIGEARAEIIARVEMLKTVPGLHEQEDRAIDDALSALRFVEREEQRYDVNQRRTALDTATRKLESLGPKIRKLNESAPSRLDQTRSHIFPSSGNSLLRTLRLVRASSMTCLSV